jgi:hypothetical protein
MVGQDLRSGPQAKMDTVNHALLLGKTLLEEQGTDALSVVD